MKAIRFALFAAIIPLFVSGCDNFSEIDARFAGYNTSSTEIGFVVNGNEVGPIFGPHSSRSFMVEVPVPVRRDRYGTGPNDEVVRVTVAVKNFTIGTLSRPITCQAGGKIVTSIYYEIRGTHPDWRESLSCTSSW